MQSAADKDRSGQRRPLLLLAEGSAAIRHLVAGKLRQQAVCVLEAVDGVHAIHAVANSSPDALVVGGSLGRLDRARFVHDLGSTKETAQIPCIVVVDGERELACLQETPLRPNVTPVIRPPSLDALCGVIGRGIGRSPTPLWGKAAEAIRRDSVAPERLGEEVGELEKAFGHFEDVLDRFKNDELPGPMVPELLREIADLAADPDLELRRLIKVTGKHQAVALRLLALANSAFYSQAGSPVTTLERAIVNLGIRKTVAVFQAVGMLGYVVGKDKRLRELIMAGLQKACFVAHAAEHLASRGDGVDGRELFVLGLLHNVGATFLLYTLALLQEEGRIATLDHESVLTMAADRGPQLNQTIAAGLKLPDDIISRLLVPGMDGSPAEEPPGAMTVLRAIWIAEQVLDQKRDRLAPTGESISLGLDVDVLSDINAKLPELLQVVNICVR